jgi:hypothetical protein
MCVCVPIYMYVCIIRGMQACMYTHTHNDNDNDHDDDNHSRSSSYYIVGRVHHYHVRHSRRQTITQMCQIISSLMCYHICDSEPLVIKYYNTHTHTPFTHTQTPTNMYKYAYGYTHRHTHMHANNLLSPSHAHTFNTCSRLVLAGLAVGAV